VKLFPDCRPAFLRKVKNYVLVAQLVDGFNRLQEVIILNGMLQSIVWRQNHRRSTREIFAAKEAQ
jgi:hypothetical protein